MKNKALSLYLRKRLFEKPKVRYVVEFHHETAIRLPKDFSPSRYRGLILCQVSQESQDSGARLYTLWEGKDNYDQAKDELRQDLGCNEPKWFGYEKDTRLDREQWWRRLTMGAVILYLGALAGALVAILALLQEYYFELFGTAKADVQVSQTIHPDYKLRKSLHFLKESTLSVSIETLSFLSGGSTARNRGPARKSSRRRSGPRTRART